jgi:hypothetical protein
LEQAGLGTGLGPAQATLQRGEADRCGGRAMNIKWTSPQEEGRSFDKVRHRDMYLRWFFAAIFLYFAIVGFQFLLS